jgi:hypothetical protein
MTQKGRKKGQFEPAGLGKLIEKQFNLLGKRVCFEHLKSLIFAPDFSVCCGACLYSIGAEASKD